MTYFKGYRLSSSEMHPGLSRIWNPRALFKIKVSIAENPSLISGEGPPTLNRGIAIGYRLSF